MTITKSVTVAALLSALGSAGLSACGGATTTPDGAGNGVVVEVSPQGPRLPPGGTIGFTATVTGTADLAVTWAVQEGPAGGAITGAGAYTAPASPGTYHVVATSRADPSKSGSAAVAVIPAGGGGTPPAPMPVISRGVRAYASAGGASDGNDGSYATAWQIGGTGWIAYDLSGVPTAQRGPVVVAWHNSATYGYDLGYFGVAGYGVPAAYTIDAHAAPGGGTPPPEGDPGWVTLASVAGNQLTTRQHAVDLGGGSGQVYNWLRMRVTAALNGNGVMINLDVHDAHLGMEDDWLFLGDSITESCWRPGPQFAQLVAAGMPQNFPVAQNGGIHGLRSWDVLATRPGTGQTWLDYWLSIFPGRYVGLSYGTNDAASAGPASQY